MSLTSTSRSMKAYSLNSKKVMREFSNLSKLSKIRNHWSSSSNLDPSPKRMIKPCRWWWRTKNFMTTQKSLAKRFPDFRIIAQSCSRTLNSFSRRTNSCSRSLNWPKVSHRRKGKVYCKKLMEWGVSSINWIMRIKSWGRLLRNLEWLNLNSKMKVARRV